MLARLRDEALEMSTAPFRLGLTATPPREPAVRQRLAALLGPGVFELAIGDLAGNFLANFDVVTLHLDLAPDERVRYDALMGAFRAVHAEFLRVAPGGAWEDFARSAARTPAGRAALASLHQARTLLAFTAAKREALRTLLPRLGSSRTLGFTANNDSAYAVARFVRGPRWRSGWGSRALGLHRSSGCWAWRPT